MSGHSKWSNIKRKKAVIDSKRSGVFTKMAKAITVAVRKGGGVGEIDMNFALRLAVEKARAVNMPKENIERAIDKGLGKGGGKEIEELLLEGYGPGGVALVIETLTDNRNRTVSEVKNLLEKHGGSLGEPGSVLYQFDRVGQVMFKGKMADELELTLIDKGLIEAEEEDGETYLYVSVPDINKVVTSLRQSVDKIEITTELIYRPKIRVAAPEGDGLNGLLESLSDHDDVQEVYVNSL